MITAQQSRRFNILPAQVNHESTDSVLEAIKNAQVALKQAEEAIKNADDSIYLYSYDGPIRRIQKIVAAHFELKPEAMTARRRTEDIAWPRQIAMFISTRLTTKTLTKIGEMFGGRDHGTVWHAAKLVQGRMDVDPELKVTVGILIDRCRRAK